MKRFLENVQSADYSPPEKLLLLSAVSIYDFSDQAVQNLANEQNFTRSLEEAPDSELLDWATTCVFFLNLVHLRGDLRFDDDLDTRLATSIQ